CPPACGQGTECAVQKMIVFTRAASSNTHLLSKAVRTTVTTLIPRDNLPNVSGSVAARLQQCPFMGGDNRDNAL
ncbi:hypothetical protein HMPREF9582_02435, partial [Cutibacterium acnes HL060PA1]